MLRRHHQAHHAHHARLEPTRAQNRDVLVVGPSSELTEENDDPFEQFLAANPLPLRAGEERQDWATEQRRAQAWRRLRHRRPFHADDTLALLTEAMANRDELRWWPSRRSFVQLGEDGQLAFELALPPVEWPHDHASGSDCTAHSTLQRLQQRRAAVEWNDEPLDWTPRPRRTLVVLLSAEASALGLWQDGVLVRHKVTTAYTTRKVQGKSQLTHERGKSGGGRRSAGGALRARETTRLFDSTCKKLVEWAPLINKCDVLIGGGTVRVWNELYSAKTRAPMERVDPRWRRVGMSTKRPRMLELERVHGLLSHGSIAY